MDSSSSFIAFNSLFINLLLQSKIPKSLACSRIIEIDVIFNSFALIDFLLYSKFISSHQVTITTKLESSFSAYFSMSFGKITTSKSKSNHSHFKNHIGFQVFVTTFL